MSNMSELTAEVRPFLLIQNCRKVSCESSGTWDKCGVMEGSVDMIPRLDSNFCWGGECNVGDCCENKPSEEEWHCQYHGENGEGWREPGDDSGTAQCPVGTVPRGKYDKPEFERVPLSPHSRTAPLAPTLCAAGV